MSRLTGAEGPWGEPGNASFVLSPGRTKYGSLAKIRRNPTHKGEKRDFYSKSEYCAGCHTVIHPTNGLRIEHTYAEWKKSPYAAKGIQCQDCHMRSVEDAIRVARTMERVVVRGKLIPRGAPEREIQPHLFVGANSNALLLTGSAKQAEMARARLASAAEIAVRAPDRASPGTPLRVEVVVTNVGAGHHLPTSLTELREMWVRLVVTDAGGDVVFETGDLDENGDIREGAIRFGSALLDAKGGLLPVEATRPPQGVHAGRRLRPPPRRVLRASPDTGPPALPVRAAGGRQGGHGRGGLRARDRRDGLGDRGDPDRVGAAFPTPAPRRGPCRP